MLRFAIPAGTVSALATFAAYGLARLNTPTDIVANRSAATLTLFLVAYWALALIAQPYTAWRIGLLAAVTTGGS